MRLHNFNPGPAVLPQSLLKTLAGEIADYKQKGYSLLEASHRSSEYEEIHFRAIHGLKKILRLSSDYEILLLGGGATLQFAMLPFNLAVNKKVAFLCSGSWANRAMEACKKLAEVSVVWKGDGDLAPPESVQVSVDCDYVHMTSNETIEGLQWPSPPDTAGIPLVADMSSDIASRLFDVSRYALIYGGTQKNLGVAGLTFVIIQKNLLERCSATLPDYLSYKVHVAKKSLYNTPPVFAVRVLDLYLQWIGEQGGVVSLAQYNRQKAEIIYAVIDEFPDFYHTKIHPSFRSQMNVVFSLANLHDEDLFFEGAAEKGFIGLRGHRAVGGVRASLYNALPLESVYRLADYMRSFAHSRA